MKLRARLWNPYIVVFMSSACVMVIELVASRLIAPRLGVSLYTWTSVIGVILAGISVGNYLGGRLSDRYASTRLLGLIFGLAALASLSTLWLIAQIGDGGELKRLPLMLWVVTYIGAVFLLPSLILGCVSPIVVKLSLQDLHRAGTTVGKIYAWSSVGSIVGTFATGFFLISWFGTKTIVVMIASILMLMAVWFMTDRPWRRAVLWGGMSLALFGLSIWLLYGQGWLCRECLTETNYFCIKVRGAERDNEVVRELVLDRLVHSYCDLEDPTHLVYDYELTYAQVMAPIIQSKPDFSAFFIGGGGYTFPRYLEAVAPQSRLVVAEIDPGVTEVAYTLLGLSRDTRIESHDMDARLLLSAREFPADSFDVVFGDAFNDYSVPYHLTTLEFGRLVDRLLKDDGLYVVNLIDGGRRGHFMRAYVQTLRQVFPHVIVIPYGEDWHNAARTTFVIVASRQPVPYEDADPMRRAMGPLELEDYLAMDAPLILRDDYVPVDNLLAPVFEDSARS